MKEVRPRKIIELQTKKEIIIPKSRKIKFTSGKGLVKSVNVKCKEGKINE